ncbi:tetratricopeptide repeat protein [Krasilnikovia sp. MM14-A1004]|uniref:tetratricopeptide repeat protein n=1 Tax=Krasilnikovia sp. MM14-A1004 TaxID=3373541 RepID=UPI00399C9D37
MADSAVEILPVAGMHSIAHLLPKSKNRCGIYVLRFANDDRYVGQAVDVVTRFATHRKNYPDIIEVTFWRVSKPDLNAVERAEIRRMEDQGFQLRNVVHTQGRLGASDFDIVVPTTEQDSWLASAPSDVMEPDTRPQHPALRRGNHVGYQQLCADARFARLEFGLRRYVAWTIPAPYRTELSYWSISARPGTLGGKRLLTLTVHNVETLFVYAPRNEPETVEFCLNIDRATILSRWKSLEAFEEQIPGMSVNEPKYRSRPGIAGIWIDNTRDFVRLLNVDGVVSAARRLNLDLMRKGPALNWKSHCLDLADRILSPAIVEPPPTDSTDSEELFEIGFWFDEQGRFDDAEPYYRRAADTGHIPSMFHLGVLCSEGAKVDEAKSWWRRATDAGDCDSAVGLGELLASQGDLASAEAVFQRAVELDDSDTALNRIGVFHQDRRRDLETAERYYRRAVAADNNDAMLNLGWLLESRDDLTGAEELFQRAADVGNSEAEEHLKELRTKL